MPRRRPKSSEIKTTIRGKLEYAWMEEDVPSVDREGLPAAWQRIFGEKFDTKAAISKEDQGDAMLFLMPNGWTAVVSYPGNSSICRPTLRVIFPEDQ